MDKGAYVKSQAVCAMIEALGMQAENEIRKSMNEYPVYGVSDFERLISKYGIDGNSVLLYLQD